MPRQLSFAKRRRLTRPAEFQRVRDEGWTTRGSFMVLAVLDSGREENARFGIITSRKVGMAVARNRVRRRLREILRHHQHLVADGMWVVAIASTRAADASYDALEAEWLRLAGRASILAP